MKEIKIFDTTLRDGEQSPGVSFNQDEKLTLARQLAKLGVDVIEAGFPIASKGDFDSVKKIASEVQGPTIAALARVDLGDLKKAVDAVEPADKKRVHVFVSTSDIHIEAQLKTTKDEVIEMAKRAVSFLKAKGVEVEFSPMDATRSDLDYLFEVCLAAEKEGADIINLPDTVGYTTPKEYKKLFKEASKVLKVPLSAHCHDDLGLAVANSLAAVEGGASQVEVSVNGIGERAGNCALEEFTVMLDRRSDVFNCKTNINFSEIATTSRLVSLYSGYLVPANKAVVGKNAFSHESGIHQDGVLKNRETYEILNPADLGVEAEQIVLGKHSGRHALNEALIALGYNLKKEDLNRCFKNFKALADKKKNVTTFDLEALVADDFLVKKASSKVEFFEVTDNSEGDPRAEVVLNFKGKEVHATAKGEGTMDAIFTAIKKATNIKAELIRYYVDSIGTGKDALAEVVITVKINEQTISGRAVDIDTTKASAEAYLRAVEQV